MNLSTPATALRHLLLPAGLLLAANLPAQTSLSFDFEDFTANTGAVGQNGWSGGAEPGLITEQNTGNTAFEEIVDSIAYSGSQSWHYDHGIANPQSLGAGTPFTPNLNYGSLQIGDSFTASFRFKAVTPGDNSWLEIDTGNAAGDDRAEFIAYINNYSSGLSVTTFDGNDYSQELTVAGDLAQSDWHLFSFTVTRTGAESNSVSISIDNASALIYGGGLAQYRVENSFDYQDSTRLKFVASPAASGFYIDDVSYSYTPVPEPGTYAAIAGALVLGLVMTRRRRQAS